MKTHLYANLCAEQARKGLTDAETAKAIGVITRTYVWKKNNGTFKLSECMALVKLFNCSFEYLFETANAEKEA